VRGDDDTETGDEALVPKPPQRGDDFEDAARVVS
jgi:hypothetical protein